APEGTDRRGERLPLVAPAVPGEQLIVPLDRQPDRGVVRGGQLREIEGPGEVRSEPRQAPVAEAAPSLAERHEPDARHDLVEVDDVHPAIDPLTAARHQVSAEAVAVDARREDGLGLPVVPTAFGGFAFDAPTDLG